MTTESPQLIDDLLNSIEALSSMEPKPLSCNSAKDVLQTLGKYLEKPYTHVHSIVCQRKWNPPLSMYLEMQRWEKLVKCNLNRSERVSYRHALEEIEKRRDT